MSTLDIGPSADELQRVVAPLRNMLDQHQQEVARLTQALADEGYRHDKDLKQVQAELDAAVRLRDLHQQALDLLKPLDALVVPEPPTPDAPK